METQKLETGRIWYAIIRDGHSILPSGHMAPEMKIHEWKPGEWLPEVWSSLRSFGYELAAEPPIFWLLPGAELWEAEPGGELSRYWEYGRDRAFPCMDDRKIVAGSARLVRRIALPTGWARVCATINEVKATPVSPVMRTLGDRMLQFRNTPRFQDERDTIETACALLGRLDWLIAARRGAEHAGIRDNADMIRVDLAVLSAPVGSFDLALGAGNAVAA